MTGNWAEAGAILNVTNDAWFGHTPGPYQHFQQARVRAVENGLPLIRSANNGISAVIDDRGRTFSGLSLDAQGVEDATLNVESSPKLGNNFRERNFWVIWAAVVIGAVFSRMGFIFGKN